MPVPAHYPGMRNRRSFLGALSLLPLAGCLTAPSANGPLPGGNGDGSGSTRPSGTGGPGLRLVSTDDQPDGPLEIAVEVTRDTATEEHPPGLRVSVTNTGDEPVAVGEARAVVFQYRQSADDLLMLLPADYDAPAEPDCWRLTDGIAVTQEYQVAGIDPGESLTADLSLYASPQSEAGTCLPVGEFRFASTYSVDPEDDGAQFTWGFSVGLE